MKKQSVLIRRALLFTAIVLTAAIAVGLPTGLLLSRNAAVRAARQELLPEARLMAAAAQSGDGALHTSAELFGAAGGVAWLGGGRADKGADRIHRRGARRYSPSGSTGPWRAMKCLGDARVGGRNYAFAAVPAGSTESPAALIAMLPATESSSALCVLAAALAGLAAAALDGLGIGQDAASARGSAHRQAARRGGGRGRRQSGGPRPTSARRARSASWPRR